jgi:predicted ester cyclase
MAAQQHKQIATRLFELLPEVVDRYNIDALDEIMAPDVKIHGTTGEHTTLSAFKEAVTEQSQLMDQSSITIHHLVAEGDHVSATFTHELTFTSEFQGIAATGKRTTFTGTANFRIVNDKVVEMWIHEDIPQMMAQLRS